MAGALIVAAATAGAIFSMGGLGTSEAQLRGEPYRGSEPPPDIRIPNVTLPSYRAAPSASAPRRARVVLLTFLDSKCTDTCPIIAALIGRTWPLLRPSEKAQVRVYAISVNPRVDTPASIRTFLAARHALTALDWLVGPVREMGPVWHAFGVLPAIDTGNDDVHSADVRVFNRRGIWVATQHAGVDLTPSNLAHDVRLALGGAST